MAEDEALVDYAEEEEDEVVATKKDSGRKGGSLKLKGRGHKDRTSDKDRGGVFESLPSSDQAAGPAQSVEGWVVFVSGVHMEAQEDQLLDIFQEVGDIKNIQMNLDRRTGFVKGYALIEYGTKEEAERAIKDLHGTHFLEQELVVDWAFIKHSGGGKRRGR